MAVISTQGAISASANAAIRNSVVPGDQPAIHFPADVANSKPLSHPV